ncbi:MAG: hypothetical protein ACQETE_11535 [Bacteroidota bacterium]
MNAHSYLRAIKIIHTIVWAFFAGCILAIPLYAWMGDITIAALLCVVVFIEVLILVVNKWSCPLTPIAARYTENRKDNFDIYLPEWLARYNKELFGSLYFLGIIYTLAKWQGWLG